MPQKCIIILFSNLHYVINNAHKLYTQLSPKNTLSNRVNDQNDL